MRAQQPARRPPRLQGLPPVVAEGTVLLILGSFPGAASLAAAQYYAHPQNQFWRILRALWPDTVQGVDFSDYATRCRWLLARGLGLWDVYASCRREGSLDADIRDAQVNDFAGLRARLPQLRAIAHNGSESFRHHRPVRAALGLPADERTAGAHGRDAPEMASHRLPSSSPANASWSFERKCAAWAEVMQAAGLLSNHASP